MPHPLAPETWPLSGAITRATEIVGGSEGTEQHTSVLTFNGTRYPSMSLDGGEATPFDLKTPPRGPEGRGRGQPR